MAEPRITGLEPDPRRPGALRVALDGRAWGAVPLEAAERLRLAAGTRLDEPTLAALGAAADEEAAFRAALRHLERRGFATRDLARRLGRRGHGPDAVGAATRRLHALGLLDDAAFARQYVESRAARGRGPARLRRDLLALGVADTVADAAIAAHWPEGADLAGATRRLAERRARQLGALPRPVLRRRLLAYLARRGYAGRDVGRIVAEVLGERA